MTSLSVPRAFASDPGDAGVRERPCCFFVFGGRAGVIPDRWLPTSSRSISTTTSAAPPWAADLAGQLRDQSEGTPLGELMTRLAAEIEEDRETLVELMDAVGADRNPIKQAGGWLAEKASRVKFSGAGSGEPDHGLFMAIETLRLGVAGKKCLWLALREVRGEHPALTGLNLDSLIERAARQEQRARTRADRGRPRRVRRRIAGTRLSRAPQPWHRSATRSQARSSGRATWSSSGAAPRMPASTSSRSPITSIPGSTSKATAPSSGRCRGVLAGDRADRSHDRCHLPTTRIHPAIIAQPQRPATARAPPRQGRLQPRVPPPGRPRPGGVHRVRRTRAATATRRRPRLTLNRRQAPGARSPGPPAPRPRRRSASRGRGSPRSLPRG